jgi:hypothetical protein
MFDRFVIAHVCVRDAAIAILPRRRLRGWGAGEKEKAAESNRSESSLAEKGTEQQSRNVHIILQGRAGAGFGMTS